MLFYLISNLFPLQTYCVLTRWLRFSRPDNAAFHVPRTVWLVAGTRSDHITGRTTVKLRLHTKVKSHSEDTLEEQDSDNQEEESRRHYSGHTESPHDWKRNASVPGYLVRLPGNDGKRHNYTQKSCVLHLDRSKNSDGYNE